MPRIPITKPYFDEEEKRAILVPLETGWVVQGPYVAEFEQKMALYCGAKYACAVSNATAALHLSLLALGITAGDQVILPSFTFVATANSIEYTGATPLFCDIDLNTFTIDVGQVRKLLSNDKNGKIKAIIPVNLFGLCANLSEIINLANDFGVKVIEDSACGLGAFIGSSHSGTWGNVGCFSFHPRKAITTGEGGMIVTNDAEIFERACSLRDHGARKEGKNRVSMLDYDALGFNYRMTDIQGAIGSCQMDKLEMILNARRRLASCYDKDLKNWDEITIPYVPDDYMSGYQAYVITFRASEPMSVESIDRFSLKRDSFMSYLDDRGISTRQGTHAVHCLSYYRNKYNFVCSDFINSYAADKLSVALPLYYGMTNEDYCYIIDSIKSFIRISAQ